MKELLPTSYGRYYEPFAGAAALFFWWLPERATLSDRNVELIKCYETLRDSPGAVEKALRALDQDAQTYLRVRSHVPTQAVPRAARFLYLSTLAFNGIHRVNLRGEFNVPYGRREYPLLGLPGSLKAHALALEKADLLVADFDAVLTEAVAADFIYLDPPYTVAHSNNGFLKYNQHMFSWDDQVRLAKTAADLAQRGCHVIVSNAAHKSVELLYPAFNKVRVSRFSRMAADSKSRGPTEELIFFNGH